MRPAATTTPRRNAWRAGLAAAALAAGLLGAAAPALAAPPAQASASAGAAAEAEPLDAEQAFRFSSRLLDARTLELRWDIAPGYYMYKAKLKLRAPDGVALGEPAFDTPLVKDDPNFGRVEIYRERMVVRVPFTGAAGAGGEITATAQGCADLGLCYPPFSHAAALDGAATATAAAPAAAPAAPVEAATTAGAGADESSRIAGLLQGGNLALVLASFFGFGLLLAFTPCVFPMIPILSGIIVGRGPGITRMRGFTLSLAYVLGMAITYTAAGVAAGLSGTMLSAALQNAWVLGGFALVFVALSLSMFGFYDLQLPAALQSRLNDSANRQGGSLGGVALMGALSALIVGPCVAAPLAGALLYIAQTGNAVLGGAALFMMALGMGAPLLLLGLTAGSLLPRAGLWMESVKKVFGVMLLGVALWLAQPVLPAWATMVALGALLLGSAMALHALEPLPADAGGLRRVGKAAGLALAVAGAAQFVGVLAGARDPLQPLAVLRGGAPGATATAAAQPALAFERVRTVAELQARLARADRPVMLDFYADWCVSCKEMEHLTFADPQVQARLARMALVQVDVTANSADDQALLKRFRLFGPPGIVFFAPGSAQETQRVVGFQDAQRFVQVLDAALAAPPLAGAPVAGASTRVSQLER